MPTEQLAPYQWRAGQSGNPLGPRGAVGLTLAKHVRALLDGDGRELAEFYVRVMRGNPLPELTPQGTPARRVRLYPRVVDRLAAAQWLSDRGWGKAVEIIAFQDGESTPEQRRALLHAMTDDERALMAALLARARARIDNSDAPVVDANGSDTHAPDAVADAPQP